MPACRSASFALLQIAILMLFACFAGSVCAQSLNLEGQTGGAATPFAYTTPSKPESISLPAAAFHLLSGGDIVGTHYQISLTAGAFERLEFGYTLFFRSPELRALVRVEGDEIHL